MSCSGGTETQPNPDDELRSGRARAAAKPAEHSASASATRPWGFYRVWVAPGENRGGVAVMSQKRDILASCARRCRER